MFPRSMQRETPELTWQLLAAREHTMLILLVRESPEIFKKIQDQ